MLVAAVLTPQGPEETKLQRVRLPLQPLHNLRVLLGCQSDLLQLLRRDSHGEFCLQADSGETVAAGTGGVKTTRSWGRGAGEDQRQKGNAGLIRCIPQPNQG